MQANMSANDPKQTTDSNSLAPYPLVSLSNWNRHVRAFHSRGLVSHVRSFCLSATRPQHCAQAYQDRS